MRVVTRGDLDGLACAVILVSKEEVSEIFLVHPQEIADKAVEITGKDILANLPYHPACAKWFDHHLKTQRTVTPPAKFDGKYRQAPSAAQLVWEYYDRDPRFQNLVFETNRLDAAYLTARDVLEPQGYILLGFTLDGRTGLGDYEGYFRRCVGWVKDLSIEDVLQQDEVAERVDRMSANDRGFREALVEHSRLDGNVIVTDFRPFGGKPPIGNRFLVYTLFPEANVSVRTHWGPGREFLVVAVAHSIFDRTCKTEVGELMAGYGGGGHRGAGTTPLQLESADRQVAEIVDTLKKNG